MAGLKGKKNGELLQAAEGAGYQVLLTVDQGIPLSREHSSMFAGINAVRHLGASALPRG